MASACERELNLLKELTERAGSDPLLTHASTGNSSAKLDGKLWIKASGAWMADALRDDIFISLELAEVNECLQRDTDPAHVFARASLETAMHALLPHRFVLHVHSVDAIAWAVRKDAVARLRSRLAEFCWEWIPYVASGLPLARGIGSAISRSLSLRRAHADVFVLANHGLVVAADDAFALEHLLQDVSRRLAIRPRIAPPPDYSALAAVCEHSCWAIPDDAAVHALATDAVSRRILRGGYLYPCHAILAGAATALFEPVASARAQTAEWVRRPFLLIENLGVVVNRAARPAELAMLSGLAQILLRLPGSAPVRYLTAEDLAGLCCPVAVRYMEAANARCRSPQLLQTGARTGGELSAAQTHP